MRFLRDYWLAIVIVAIQLTIVGYGIYAAATGWNSHMPLFWPL